MGKPGTSRELGRLSMTEDVIKKVEKVKQKVDRFLNDTDLAIWYRGMSQFQVEAANALKNAIRDDTEQSSSHRVRAVLRKIGISPVTDAKDVKLLMRLSRGNDLAFLWFLMELRYKSAGPAYSINEQLIMSSIAHLDMIPTLRELDRILPPPEMAKNQVQKRKRQAEIMQEKLQQKQKARKPKTEHMLPYFEKLVRPKYYGKPLSIPVPPFTPYYGYYDNYKDPNFGMVNENNRWYTDYKLQPSKRIVTKIIKEQIEIMFEDYEAASRKAEKTCTLCEYHKLKEEIRQALKDKLIVEARDRCFDYMNPTKAKREVGE